MQAYYQAQLEQFWDTNEDEILGTLTSFHVQALEHLQTRVSSPLNSPIDFWFL